MSIILNLAILFDQFIIWSICLNSSKLPLLANEETPAIITILAIAIYIVTVLVQICIWPNAIAWYPVGRVIQVSLGGTATSMLLWSFGTDPTDLIGLFLFCVFRPTQPVLLHAILSSNNPNEYENLVRGKSIYPHPGLVCAAVMMALLPMKIVRLVFVIGLIMFMGLFVLTTNLCQRCKVKLPVFDTIVNDANLYNQSPRGADDYLQHIGLNTRLEQDFVRCMSTFAFLLRFLQCTTLSIFIFSFIGEGWWFVLYMTVIEFVAMFWCWLIPLDSHRLIKWNTIHFIIIGVFVLSTSILSFQDSITHTDEIASTTYVLLSAAVEVPFYAAARLVIKKSESQIPSTSTRSAKGLYRITLAQELGTIGGVIAYVWVIPFPSITAVVLVVFDIFFIINCFHAGRLYYKGIDTNTTSYDQLSSAASSVFVAETPVMSTSTSTSAVVSSTSSSTPDPTTTTNGSTELSAVASTLKGPEVILTSIEKSQLEALTPPVGVDDTNALAVHFDANATIIPIKNNENEKTKD